MKPKFLIVKKFFFLLFATVSLLLTAAMPEQSNKAEIGIQVPRLTINNSNSSAQPISLRDLKGKNIILHFWSIHDPESRIKNHQLDIEAASLPDTRYIAICIDENDTDLARMIIKNDNNRPENQFLLADIDHPAELISFLTGNTSSTFRINAQGTIYSID